MEQLIQQAHNARYHIEQSSRFNGVPLAAKLFKNLIRMFFQPTYFYVMARGNGDASGGERTHAKATGRNRFLDVLMIPHVYPRISSRLKVWGEAHQELRQ
jgi:hypothetical protein